MPADTPPLGCIAYRCDDCNASWPRLDAYVVCPGCEQTTYQSGSHRPMNGFQAAERARRLRVDRELRGRDLARMEGEVMAWIRALPEAPVSSLPMQGDEHV